MSQEGEGKKSKSGMMQEGIVRGVMLGNGNKMYTNSEMRVLALGKAVTGSKTMWYWQRGLMKCWIGRRGERKHTKTESNEYSYRIEGFFQIPPPKESDIILSL